MLEYILKRQAAFQSNFFKVGGLTKEDKIKWTKENILCLHQELAEVMNSMDWKTYHSYGKIYSIDNTKEEIIDCFKFLLTLMVIWDIDSNELLELFKKKSDIVENRLKLK